MEAGGSAAWGRARLLRLTMTCWAVAFTGFMTWSLATPLWGSPDAPSHDLMAYHAVRDLSIEKTDEFAHGVTSNAVTEATEGLVASATSVSCYAFQTTSASCIVGVRGSEEPADFVNSAGRNIPTYYLATGWPSLIVGPEDAVWANRAAAAAIASLFVAWAASAALTRRRRSVALTGVVVATTPMVMYLGGAVNPNSLEIVCGIAVAACSVVFLQERDTWLGHVMFRRTMIAIAVMCSIRMLGPVWALGWAVAFAMLATAVHWRHVFSRRGLPWLALPVVACVADVVWTLSSGVTDYQAEAKFDNTLWANIGLSRHVIDTSSISQQIGVFGWLDTPMPPGALTAYTWAALFLVFTAAMRLTARQLTAIAFLVAAQYLLPIVLQALQYNVNGPVWQGRYTLPLTVAIPIFALMLNSQRPDTTDEQQWLRRMQWAYPMAVAVLAYAHFKAFTTHLRRNVSGYGGPGLTDGHWEPFGSAEVVLGVHTVFLVVVLAAVVHLYWHDSQRSDLATGGTVPLDTSPTGVGGRLTARLRRQPTPAHTTGP